MEFLKYAGAVVTNAMDALADANRRLALTNRLKAIEKAETAKARAAYEALGRYVAQNIDSLDADTLQTMKETAETAEQHAALAHKHVQSMRKPETVGVIRRDEEETAEETAATAEETVPAAEETVEAVAEPVEEAAEEAAEDANDDIPFV